HPRPGRSRDDPAGGGGARGLRPQLRHPGGRRRPRFLSPIMHPSHFAAATPDKPAVIMAQTEAVTTFRQMEDASNRAAHLLRSLGLRPGDAVAVCLGNTPDYFALAWAAQRSGLYFVALSSRLTLAEIDYIARDCGAKVLIAGADLPNTAALPTSLSDLALF